MLENLAFCTPCLLSAVRSGSQESGWSLAGGHQVGAFTLLSPLGRGGFSEVYAARAEGEESTVAIKVLKKGLDSQELSARFRAEQRLLRGLNHPGIVRVLESGLTPDGRSYFVMELVDGLPIVEFCEAENLDLRGRVRLMVRTCEAVHHAHQKGVLHRDLKPSNILVDEDGSPKIIDFGIAKALDDDGSLGLTLVTRLGQVMGTPVYMPPEQAAGGDEADVRSDLYSLGAVLFEMVTGRPPYLEEDLARCSPLGWATYLREHEPRPPSSYLKSRAHGTIRLEEVRGDLDRIISKAMAPDPERRYASVEALAADLRQWLAGGVISARPPSLGYQFRHLVRRYKVQSALALAGLMGLVAAVILATILARQARQTEHLTARERDQARRAEQAAEEARAKAEHESYQAALQLARLQIANGQPYLAAERLRATPPGLRQWEWRYLLQNTPQPAASMATELSGAQVVAATPDGRFAAVAENLMVHVVDLEKHLTVGRFAQPLPVHKLALSDNGEFVACLVYPLNSPQGLVRVAQVRGTNQWQMAVDETGDLAWEPEPTGGALLVVSGNGHTPTPGLLARLDRRTGQVLAERTLLRYKLAGRGIVVSPDGQVAAVRTHYAEFQVIQLPTLEKLSEPAAGETLLVGDLLFDAAHRRLLYAQGDKVLTVEEYRQPPQVVGTMHLPGLAKEDDEYVPIRRLNLQGNGRWLAIGDRAHLAEDGLGQARPTLQEQQQVNLTGGRRLALLAGGRLEIRPEMIPPPSSELSSFGLGDESEARRIALAPDQKSAVFQTWDRQAAYFFTLQVAAPLETYSAVVGPNFEWSFLPVYHPDGTALLAGRSGVERVWREGGKLRGAPLPLPPSAWSAAVAVDGAAVAFGVPEGVALLDWQTKIVKQRWPLAGAPFHVMAASDGKTFFALGSDSVLHRLGEHPEDTNLGQGKHPRPLTATWHRERGLLALAEGTQVVLYQLSSEGAPVEKQRLSVDGVALALAFDLTAHRLAVATEARTLTLWDWEYRLPLLELPIRSMCSSIQFSDDGEWMVHTDYSPSVVLRKGVPMSAP